MLQFGFKKIAVFLLCGLVVLAALVVFPYFVIQGQKSQVKDKVEDVAVQPVAIVFGAGIKRDNTPSDMLEDRLTVASRLYHLGKVKTILVSGDNRFENYSEPDVMRDVLVRDFKIPVEDIQIDYAGRRTYDTCIRAKKFWGVDHAVLITQDFHLPRAIWTCEKLGIESVGVSASLRPYMFAGKSQLRELPADLNAFIDIYLWHPSYLKGEFVKDIDP